MSSSNAVWRQETLDRLRENVRVAQQRYISSLGGPDEEFWDAYDESVAAQLALFRYEQEVGRRPAVAH